MSLTDALLLEPHPFEIWIADRTESGVIPAADSNIYPLSKILDQYEDVILSALIISL